MGERSAARRGRGRKFIGVFLGVLLLAIIAGVVVLKIVFTPERLRAELVRVTSESTGLDVDVAQIRLSILPLGVSLSGLRLSDPGAEGPAFVELESGLVRVELLPLLKKALIVDSIRLTGPRVNLEQRDGQLVLPGKLAAAPGKTASPDRGGAAPTAPSGMRAAIRSFEIVDGGFALFTPDGAGDMSLHGISLSGDLEAVAGGERIRSRGELRLAGLDVAALAPYRETLDALKPVVNYDVEFDAPAAELRLTELRLAAAPLDLRLAGRVTGIPDAPKLDVELAPRTYELSDLLPLVPPALIPEGRSPRAAGPIELAARVQADLTDPEQLPEIDAQVRLGGAEFGMEGFPVGIAELAGSLRASATEVRIDSLSGKLGESPFHVGGRVTGLDTPDAAAFDLAVRADFDLGVLGRGGFLPPGTAIEGGLQIDVRAAGAAADPTASQVRGSVVLANARAELPELPRPIEDLNATVKLSGQQLALEKARARVGRSQLEASGEVSEFFGTPRIRLRGSAPLLDLDELAPTPPAGAGEATPTPPAGAPAPLVPPLPPVDLGLTLAVDSLITGGNGLRGVALEATVKEGRANVKMRVRRGDFGGTILHELDAGLDLVGQTARGSFRSPRVDAYRVPLTQVRGDVNLGEDRVLRVHNVTAQVWTGSVAGSAEVNLADPLDPAFGIDANASSLQANDFLTALTPADNLLYGALDIRSSFSGHGSDPQVVSASLSGKGEVTGKNGRLERTPAIGALWGALNLGEKQSLDFRDFQTAFEVADGRLLTRDVRLSGAEADWTASGFVAFDGTLDYDVHVELNEALSQKYRERIGGELGKLLAGDSGRLALDLKITGQANNPRVSVDTSALLERAKEKAQEAVKQNVKDAIQGLFGKKKDK